MQPNYTERFPHEFGAVWAFEGIRNHYTEAFYGIDVAALRREDPDRFLAFARATSAELIEATFAEWRRAGSCTRGALIWFLRDLFPGAGWGLLDAGGFPKAAYYGAKRAFRSCGLVLTDENLNGLAISLFNETAHERVVTLSLTCLRDGATPVMRAATDLTLAPRAVLGLAATTLWGGFFDTTYAYRFGEPSHDVTIARLSDARSGSFIADAFHFPLGRGHERHDLGLSFEWLHGPEARAVTLRTRRFAQSIRLTAPGATFSDNYFHLAPGLPRTISIEGAFEPRALSVTALNAAPDDSLVTNF